MDKAIQWVLFALPRSPVLHSRRPRSNPRSSISRRSRADKRAALQDVRTIIRAAAPGVEEYISYNLPAFRLGGKTLLWIGAAANHCALYGLQETRPGRPLPAALVRRLVEARIEKARPATAPKRRT